MIDFKITYFKEVDEVSWNKWVSQIEQTCYCHCWDWLNYCSGFPNIKKHLSFVLLADKSHPLAICPLAITYNKAKQSHEISFSGIPVGVPALANLKPSLRRRTMDAIFDIIQDCSQKWGVKKINMLYHPLNSACCSGRPLSHKYSFELLRYRMLYQVNNTLILDLTCSEEKLFSNISKYHRRHINRAKKKGLEVRVFNKMCNFNELNAYFCLYQKAHFTAAGRMTRPLKTWNAMHECALKGKASLFVTFIDNTPISYLYCGEFSLMAFGWSQANVKKYQGKYSPRHLLEWEAAMYYKKKGYRFYEVGERYYGPQFFHIPSEKELSISVFRERYGGILLPRIMWTGYYEEGFLKNDLKNYMENFIHSSSLKMPGAKGFFK